MRQALIMPWPPSQTGFDLLADTSGVLVLLAATLLVLRTFRETYLVTWVLGWACYLVYQLSSSRDFVSAPVIQRITSQVAFVAGLALFVAAVLYYVHERRRLVALVFIASLAIVVGGVRAVWLPDSLVLTLFFRALYTVIAIAGAVKLAAYSRGRRQLGPWMMAVTLVLLHYDRARGAEHLFSSMDTVVELLLGLSMLVVVLDDSKERTQRLYAVNAITTAIAQAQDHGTIVRTALAELKKLLHARAAWFRILQGEHLVITHQIGLSEAFLRQQAVMDAATSPGARIAQGGKPVILSLSTADARVHAALASEGLHHLAVIPVKGKSSTVGTICLAQGGERQYPAEEMKFLANAAHQVGIAMENLDLMQQILRSHREWIRTFDAIEDWILVHDQQFRVLRINRTLLQRLSGEPAEVVHRRCEDLLPGAGRWHGCPYCDGSRANFSEGPDPCFGGFSIVTSSTFTDDGAQVTGTIHIIRDTTERRASEEKYRLLFEQAQEGVFVTTPDGALVDCNDAFVRMLGYDSRQDVLKLDVPTDIYADPAQRKAFTRAMAATSFVRNYEVQLRRRNGTVITALENSFASSDASGNVVRYQGFLLDITEIKRAEAEIRRRNRELHALNAIAVVGAQSFDLNEILQNALHQVVELFQVDTGGVWLLDESAQGVLRERATHGRRGPSAPELRLPVELLRSFRDRQIEILTEEDLPQLPEFASAIARAEGLLTYVWVIMWSKDHPMGVLAIGSRTGRCFTPTDRSLLVAIGRQVATTIEKVRLYQETRRAYEDLRRTQEQLLQSEKMSAIGQLISGVAHELNNPLTAILGYAELLDGEALSDRARDFTTKLAKQAQRTQRLVQNLLSFARQRKPEKKLVDIRHVMEDTLALRDYDLKLNNIAVESRFDNELPAVLGDGHQIEQVFLNIINNAVDAILERGHGGRLDVAVFRRNGKICAEFHDSGTGIREPKKVFDPFYTTKGVGKGTGLGLSICYGIVKEHGGEIEASNHPDGGALFRVLLPATQQVIVPETVPLRVPASPLLRGRILVVDDEDAVREFEREALTSAGADVVVASSGKEALAHLECDHFDAVILDTSMPGEWSGLDIYRWIAQNRAGAERNIILAVSNISDKDTSSLLDSGNVLFLAKPFQVPELIAVTQSLLARKKAAASR